MGEHWKTNVEVIDRFKNRTLDGRSKGLRKLMGTRKSPQAWGEAGSWRLEPDADRESGSEAGAGSGAAGRNSYFRGCVSEVSMTAATVCTL